MAYPETIRYLESFINYEKFSSWPYKESLKLERINGFLFVLGNPQESLRCIHIAGTKGKGSTCAFLTYILREAGYKVGLYTSPHLYDFRERIRILQPSAISHQPSASFEGMILKEELEELVERVKPAVEKYNQSSQYGPLTFFEIYTALAFIYFQEKKVDFCVLETGLGGRLDATNTVNPLVAAITPISYEHTQKLGNTLREIATEKAGIIKKSLQLSAFSYQPIVISAPQEEEAASVIRNRCKEVGVKLYEVDRDIIYQNLKINLLGKHQLVNAAVAVGITKALQDYGINVDDEAIRKGLLKTVWPGRCEVISQEPLIILDGAQNIASARALKEAIREEFRYRKLILILGISNDKDIEGICKELKEIADEIILTKSNNPRATEPKVLAEYFNGKVVSLKNNVSEAKLEALKRAEKKDLVLVTGSLFVVGEFRDEKIRAY